MEKERIYLLVKETETFDWKREDIIIASRDKHIVERLQKKFESTAITELNKRPWIDHISYYLNHVDCVSDESDGDIIFNEFLEELK